MGTNEKVKARIKININKNNIDIDKIKMDIDILKNRINILNKSIPIFVDNEKIDNSLILSDIYIDKELLQENDIDNYIGKGKTIFGKVIYFKKSDIIELYKEL